MSYEQIMALVSAIASFLFVVLIPNIILLIKKIRDYKNAKTEAEKNEILNEISNSCVKFIQDAEASFKSVDSVLKARGEKGCGSMKKENVMTKINNLCIQKGITFDEEYWSKKVEELVALTKNVNSNN